MSARRKPSECATRALSRAELGGPTRKQVAGVLPPPHPAAQLVQLGDAEPLGVLDQHDRRVGDVDSDLDDRRGDQHPGPPRGEGVHRLLLLPRTHRAVEQGQIPARKLARRAAGSSSAVAAFSSLRTSDPPAPPTLCPGALRILGLLDHGTHDERLAPGRELGTEMLVGGRTLGLAGHQPRADRPAPAGQLMQRGRVEVAVAGQREGPGNRRGGHVQDVGLRSRHAGRCRPPAPRADARRSGAAHRSPPRPGSGRRRPARSGHGCRRAARARRWPACPGCRPGGGPASIRSGGPR